MNKLHILILLLLLPATTLISQNKEEESKSYIVFDLFEYFQIPEKSDSIQDKKYKEMELFDYIQYLASISDLKQFLTHDGLPHHYYPYIACKIQYYYYKEKSNEFNYFQVNSIVDRYISSGSCFQDINLLNTDCIMFTIAQFLNGVNGDYNKQLEYLKVLEEGYKRIANSTNNVQYFVILNNLAMCYSNLGFYHKSLDIDLVLVKRLKRLLGENHPNYLIVLNNLASDYSKLGNYNRSIEINLKLVDKRKNLLGEQHPDYLNSLHNLASDYSNLGDYIKSLEINLELEEKQKEILGEQHLDFFKSLHNLALDYSNLGKYRKSLKINLQLVENRKQVLGEQHPDYLNSLNNLMDCYGKLGKYNKALEIGEELEKLGRKLLGVNHPTYFLYKNNFARQCLYIGDNDRSVKLLADIVGRCKSQLDFNNSNYLFYLQNLANVEASAGRIDSSTVHYSEYYNKTKDRVIKYFSTMSGSQRDIFLDKYSLGFEYVPFYLNQNKNTTSKYAGEIYDASLFIKGLLLNTTRDFEELINENGAQQTIAQFVELNSLKLEAQKLEEQPIKERYHILDSLQDIIQTKEMKLIKLSAEFGEYTNNLKISWKDVQSKLGKNEVAIEFVEYPTLSDTVKYAALVLRKNWSAPKMISLFQKDQLEKWLKSTPDNIYSNSTTGKKIKELIWKPLEEYIDKDDKVYFSASGLLYKIAIENLPVNDSMAIGDCYSLYRLSSTKELVTHKATKVKKTAVLYGGLNYNVNDRIMVAQSHKFFVTKNIYASRGGYQDFTVRSGFSYLPGSLKEVTGINRVLRQSDYLVTDYIGNKGNEESFISLTGKYVGILHIATHGFFLPVNDKDRRKQRFNSSMSGYRSNENLKYDPMFRSGLILSGGNKAWQGNAIPIGIEDGILTAKEISMLDFNNTDMVVLSACETGLGDVSNEGVFGLQRSFKQAGVQTIVMTLWKIDDQATGYFMTEFYKRLLTGISKRAAFLEAKKSCREKFHDPRYWAAFIMLD